MILTPFTAMQKAIAIVNDSEHKKNKIAACLYTKHEYIARHNHRPPVLSKHFTPDIRIGQSSQFIHAEVACIFESDFATEGAFLCVTDPFCPNCAKAICESGVAHVYIDHKGLDKDFALRRGDDFESLSLLMLEKAGIPVSILHRKDEKIEPLIAPPILTRKGSAKGIEFFHWDENTNISDCLDKFRIRQSHTAWVIARIMENNNQETGILVFEELTSGLTPHDYSKKQNLSDKYRFPVDPLNRLLFFVRRKGFEIIDKAVGCNLHPASRALVNASDYGITNIYLGEMSPDHDTQGLDAGKILHENNIISIQQILK